MPERIIHTRASVTFLSFLFFVREGIIFRDREDQRAGFKVKIMCAHHLSLSSLFSPLMLSKSIVKVSLLGVVKRFPPDLVNRSARLVKDPFFQALTAREGSHVTKVERVRKSHIIFWPDCALTGKRLAFYLDENSNCGNMGDVIRVVYGIPFIFLCVVVA